jgi:hypothetical protein
MEVMKDLKMVAGYCKSITVSIFATQVNDNDAAAGSHDVK